MMKHAENNNKKEKRGLYISLALCLVAIALAAWGTYDSLTGYIDENTNDVGTVVQSPKPNENDVKNEYNATPAPTATPSPEPTIEPTAEPTAKPEPAEENSTTETVDSTVTEPSPEPVSGKIDDTFVYPVESKIVTNEYSVDTLVYNKTMRDYRVHSGIDIAADEGEVVSACNNGTVKNIYNDLLLGNVIEIEHGEYTILYCGLQNTNLVNIGDEVTSNLPIGTVGIVPSEKTSSHIHIEVLKDGKNIDPKTLIFK